MNLGIEQWIEQAGGTIGAAAVVLVMVGLAHVALRSWARRRERRDEAVAVDAPSRVARVRWFVSRTLRDSVPPLALMIWIHGLYGALSLLVPRIPLPAVVAPALAALQWGYAFALTASVFWLLSRFGIVIEALMISLSRRVDTAWDNVMLPLVGKAARRLLPIPAFGLGITLLALPGWLEESLQKLTIVALIGVVAWVLFQIVEAAAALVLRRHRVDVRDNLQARAIHTQVVVLQKVAYTVIVVFTLASMLMVFESARRFGASILASAGLAGIVVGLAAQRSIATLLAGFQIAVTQPIRVDDVVIVENEWGRIEDITLTYVVVRIWDQRRLVVPMNHFIERPFQNWTRTSADILGTVFLHVDYTAPIDQLRAELTRILQASKNWDGRVNALQVTDAKERTLEIRALASAADASMAWDLRCEIREKLVDFLQRHSPESLPRTRASVGAFPY